MIASRYYTQVIYYRASLSVHRNLPGSGAPLAARPRSLDGIEVGDLCLVVTRPCGVGQAVGLRGCKGDTLEDHPT